MELALVGELIRVEEDKVQVVVRGKVEALPIALEQILRLAGDSQ